MVDDRPDDTRPSSGSPDLGRPKRAPPTIDLDASEVTSATAASDAGAGPIFDEAKAENVDEAGPDKAVPEPAPDVVAAPPQRPSRMSTVLISACSGAIAAAVVMGLTTLAQSPWSATSEPAAPQVGSDAIDALTARIARVESRPAMTASAPADPAIAGRIDALEKSLAALRSDLAGTKTQSERAAAAVSDLKSAPREPAAAAIDLTPINERLGQIERTASALKTEAAQQSAKPVDDRPLRRVVAASLLDGSVKQSEPYAAALAAAKPLAADASVLKPLDVFAASGVPSAAMLSRDLLAQLAKLVPAQDSAITTTGSFVDRLQAGAAKLVRIQRTDAVAGNDRDAVVARITAAARGNDISTARREATALPPADRASLQSWTDKVDARDAALAASRQFAADATAALSKPAP